MGMLSLKRIERLGQIKGMGYEPTPSDVGCKGVAPNCYEDWCRDYDMDYFNSDFELLWGGSGGAGRNDLENIRNQNVNLMRLYNWTGNETGGAPLRDHKPYLDRCQELALGTMVPFSNYNVTLASEKARNTARSIVGELAFHDGRLHPAVKMWQVTNEFELGKIKPEEVASLVEYIVEAEEAAGVIADDNKIPIVVSVSTAERYGVRGQSMGQIAALKMAFQTGGTLPDGTMVKGNDFLNEKNVFNERFVIGVQSFQYIDEIEKFVDAVRTKYQEEVPVLLTEHGFNAVEAAKPVHGGNGKRHDEENQARIVARQIAAVNQICKKYKILRGMCFFQWLNTYYKCGKAEGVICNYESECTEGNYGEVKWCDFGAPQPKASKTGKTAKGQGYPVDEAIHKAAVFQAVSAGFAAA